MRHPRDLTDASDAQTAATRGSADPVSWPYDGDTERVAAAWLTAYARACTGRAVCELLSVTGPPPGGSEAALVDLHDRATLATSGLPLA